MIFCIVPRAYSYVKTSKSGLSHLLVLHREGWGLGGTCDSAVVSSLTLWSPLAFITLSPTQFLLWEAGSAVPCWLLTPGVGTRGSVGFSLLAQTRSLNLINN